MVAVGADRMEEVGVGEGALEAEMGAKAERKSKTEM